MILGDANQARGNNHNDARYGTLPAGLPTSLTGATVNRLCPSSLEVVIHGPREATKVTLLVAAPPLTLTTLIGGSD